MHKKVLLLTVAALVLALCLVACGETPAQETTQLTTAPETTGASVETIPNGTNETMEVETTGGETEPEKEPTLDYGTDVGSGRVEGTQNSQNQGTDTEATKPTESKPADQGLSMNYQQYMALSGQEQQLFYDKHFSNDPLGFANWFQKIKQEYDDETPEIIATGPVDIGDYINP